MNSLVECVIKYGQIDDLAPAIMYKNEILTYTELAKRIKTAAAKLRRLGVKRKDCILLESITDPSMIVAYLAIQYCGGIVVFVDANTIPKNIFDIYCETSAVIFLTEKHKTKIDKRIATMSIKELSKEENGLLQDDYYMVPDKNDFAEILFTTGTTGKPKGVVHTYNSINCILLNTIKGTGMIKDDGILLPLPLGHSFALRVLRAALFLGASVILQNGFTFINDIEVNQKKYNCTALIAVPSTMEMLYQYYQDKFKKVLGRFRYIEVGAGSLSGAQRIKFSKLLSNTQIINTWGSSETGGVIFFNIRDALKESERITALGKPLPNAQFKIVDDGGKAIVGNQNCPGHLALKGDMVMHEYWNNSNLTLKSIKDGWFITNDIVYIDAEGYLHMLGRVDDIVKVGGENVSTIEIENVVGQYNGILECVCIGVEDQGSLLGYSLVLFGTITPEYENAGFCDFLNASLERYKVPSFFVLMDKIPRNRMGKIDRNKLKLLWINTPKKRTCSIENRKKNGIVSLTKYPQKYFYKYVHDNTDEMQKVDGWHLISK